MQHEAIHHWRNLTSVRVKNVGSVRHPPPIVSCLASMRRKPPQSDPQIGAIITKSAQADFASQAETSSLQAFLNPNWR